MNKKFGVLLTICFSLVFSNSIAIAAPNLKNLSELGFSQEEIKDLDQEQIDRYSQMNAKLVAKSEKYFKYTKEGGFVEIPKRQALREVEEFNRKIKEEHGSDVSIMSNPNTQSCSWLKQTTSASNIGGKIYYFKNSWQWLADPIITLTDVVGMTHSSSISVNSNSERLYYYYDKYNTHGVKEGTGKETYYTADKKDVYGYAYKYDIKGRSADGYYVFKNQRGYMEYTGKATPDNFIGYSNVFGHYSHQQLTSSISIGLSVGSMAVSPGFAFDEAPDTNAQFYIP